MDSKQIIVRQLVEEAMSSGRAVDEVCGEYPELVGDVRTLWLKARSFSDQIDSLFPSAEGEPEAEPARGAGATHVLPRIPGYEVEGVVGVGGMGVVYKAKHLALNRTVAIKVPLAGMFATASERRRHAREARAIAALDHPNIVAIHDVGEFDGRPFLTMEFIDGPHLGERLEKTAQPARAAAELVATLADAVQRAHLLGVTHRDLKPANVLIARDGTPKITDFGLARQLESDATLTAAGVHFGTPSYMAPELARGQSGVRSESVDVYSLGAILYEMLAGRPPFQGGNAIETMRQVLEDEVTPFSRLNPKVPRDLEIVCLKCLKKEASRRYVSAGELAGDLRRFLKGEPIQARPAGLPERAMKWVRRRPAQAVAAASVIVLASALAAAVVWRSSEQAERTKAAGEDLREAVRLQGEMSWAQADSAIERAALRLGGGGPSDVRERLQQARRDSALARRLIETSFYLVDSASPYHEAIESDKVYAAVMRQAGIVTGADDSPVDVASRVRASAIAPALLDALDAWAAVAQDARMKQLLQSSGELVDPSPLRRRLNLLTSADQGAVDRLVSEIEGAAYRPMMLVAFSRRFEESIDIVPLLTKVQRAHQTDFWPNFALGDALADVNGTEAIRYYQAAMVLLPEASVIQNNFGTVLSKAGRHEEARRAFELALQRHPDSEIIRVNLAGTLVDLGRYEEAMGIAQDVLRMKGEEPFAHVVLAEAQFRLGKSDEAIATLRQAIKMPALAEEARHTLQSFLQEMGKLEEMRTVWAEAVAHSPEHHEHWDGYAELCLYLGDEGAYRKACEQLLQRFGNDPNPGVSERTGRACLLLPAPPAQLAAASAAIERALKAGGATSRYAAYYRVAGALAAYRAGDYRRVLSLLDLTAREVLGPMPLLIQAMAHHQLGHEVDARDALARALEHGDWKRPPISQNLWMCHILRREAESLIAPKVQPAADGEAGSR